MGSRKREIPRDVEDSPLDLAKPETWPEDVRRLVHPRRGIPLSVPVLARDAIWHEMRERFEVSPTRRYVKPAVANRVLSSTVPSEPADLESEASLARAVTERENPKGGVLCERTDLVIDHWVATGGCLHAVRAVRAWCEGPNRPGPAVPLGVFSRLATHLAVADSATYEACREAGLALPLPAPLPVEALAGLAYLFPESGLADDASRWVGGGNPWVHVAIAERSSLARLVEVTHTSFAIEPPTGGKASVMSMLYTWLAVFGSDALPHLATMVAVSRSSHAQSAARVLARVGSLESIRHLLGHAERANAHEALATVLERRPSLAVPAVIDHLRSRPRNGASLVALLRAAFASNHSPTVAAVSMLDDERRRFCETHFLPGEEVVVRPSAAAASALEVALSMAAQPEPSTTLALTRLEAPARMVWPPGWRNAWLSHSPQGSPEALEILIGDADTVAWLESLDPEVASSEAAREHARSRLATVPFFSDAKGLACLPQHLASLILRARPSGWYEPREAMRYLAARDQDSFLDALLAFAEANGQQLGVGLEALLPFRCDRIALVAARARLGKAARGAGSRWLRWHPETASRVLVPVALGASKDRVAARRALRMLADAGARATVLGAAQQYGDECVRVVTQLLDARPPWPRYLESPTVLDARTVPALVVAETSTPLDGARMQTVLAVLQHAELGEPEPRLAAVRAATTSASRNALVRTLLQGWVAIGCSSEHAWALRALAWLGDDELVPELVARLEGWAREGQFPRAALALDVLENQETAASLAALQRIARDARARGLRRQASERLDRAALRRGLTLDDLADLSVPDLGLDARGTRELDFAGRPLIVELGPTLEPVLKDGPVTLKAPAAPMPGDDPHTATRDRERWERFVRDVKRVARDQARRLELAMVQRRRWNVAAFRRRVVEHPILGRLAQGLAWGLYEGATLRMVFRVAEDASLSTLADEPTTLDEALEVGVVHPLEWSQDDAGAFARLHADYRLTQPFQQLGRQSHRLSETDASRAFIQRWQGVTAKASALSGLRSVGWSQGEIGDHGIYRWLEKHVPDGVLCVAFEPGLSIQSAKGPSQAILGLGLRGFWQGEANGRLDGLHPVHVSEAIRDLRVL